VARNLGNGHHWLALLLGGHWRVKPELMRTNSHAIGTRVIVEGQGIHVSHDHTTPDSGLAQSIGPVVVGLGKQETADLVQLRWPDGVMQCELNVPIDDKRVLAENNRKTGSCPVLFTWNGTRFVCVGDFLGGGGLGYLVAPGVYSQPDRDEAVAIAPEQLRAEQGFFRLSITEPMDEVAYDDGTWQMIEPHAGYPAGLPRLTTLDLTGKLTGGRCVLRVRTNMECYYD
jgi:ASPIC and UnbV